MTATLSNVTQMMDAIRNASPADVQDIDAEIGRLEKEIERLRAVRDLIEPVRPVNRIPRTYSPRTYIDGKSKTTISLEMIANYLYDHEPETPYKVAKLLGLKNRTMINMSVDKNTWFQRIAGKPIKFTLTAEGRAAVESRRAALNGTAEHSAV